MVEPKTPEGIANQLFHNDGRKRTPQEIDRQVGVEKSMDEQEDGFEEMMQKPLDE